MYERKRHQLVIRPHSGPGSSCCEYVHDSSQLNMTWLLYPDQRPLTVGRSGTSNDPLDSFSTGLERVWRAKGGEASYGSNTSTEAIPLTGPSLSPKAGIEGQDLRASRCPARNQPAMLGVLLRHPLALHTFTCVLGQPPLGCALCQCERACRISPYIIWSSISRLHFRVRPQTAFRSTVLAYCRDDL